MWKGMIAFDRPTWIRALNKKTTFFITGQWFLHHIMHNEDTLATALDLPTAGARSRPFCGSDKFTPCTDPNGNGNFRDDVRSWESLRHVRHLHLLPRRIGRPAPRASSTTRSTRTACTRSGTSTG